jgi:hypothetical protein
MGTTNRKLPRRPHADKPGPGETIRKRGGADLQNGWYGRHGTLYLTDERLVFVPTILDTLLGGKRREWAYDEITEVERYPSSPEGMIPGGKRPRMIIHTAECGYELMVSDMDAWIDAIEVMYAHRGKNGHSYKPTVVRDGSDTALLSEIS